MFIPRGRITRHILSSETSSRARFTYQLNVDYDLWHRREKLPLIFSGYHNLICNCYCSLDWKAEILLLVLLLLILRLVTHPALVFFFRGNTLSNIYFFKIRSLSFAFINLLPFLNSKRKSDSIYSSYQLLFLTNWYQLLFLTNSYQLLFKFETLPYQLY